MPNLRGLFRAATLSLTLALFAAVPTTAVATNPAVGLWRAPGCGIWTSLPAVANIVEACMAAAVSCGGTYTGIAPSHVWYVKDCRWTGAYTAGQPVTWDCYNGTYGYSRRPFFQCSVDPDRRERPQCQQPAGALANASTPNPINLLTGSKLLRATDFETSDGLLRVRRAYRSLAAGEAAVSAWPPVGLGLGWRFEFMPELHIRADFSSGAPYVSLHWPDGSVFDFVRSSTGTMDPLYQSGIPFSQMRLSFVGSWPGDLTTIPSTQTQWQLVDGDGNVWDLEAWNATRAMTPLYNVARPTMRTTREGYQWTYTYASGSGSMEELQSITDTFGRTLTFEWIWHDPNAVLSLSGFPVTPEAIGSIGLPDGSTLTYLYTPLALYDAFESPDVLTKVEHRDAEDVLIDDVEYHHEDSDFPSFVTGITDARGIRAWNYSYDSDGRAEVSERAGGVDRYEVTYSAHDTNPVDRTVTGPLGRDTVYHYSNKWTTRLVGIDGQSTSSCPADYQTISYSSAGYISSTTDQEGRVTNYERDGRGRPTEITEAVGTADERTTAITWHYRSTMSRWRSSSRA